MSRDVAVLGVGMHPWGKWGRRFTRHGVAAARAALADAGLDWTGATSGWSPARHRARRLPRKRRRGGLRPGAGLAGRPGGRRLRRVRLRGAGPRHRPGAHPRRPGGHRPGRGCGRGAQGLLRARRGRRSPTTRTGCASACWGHQPGALRAVRTTPHGAARRHARGLRPGQGEERGGRRRQPARPPDRTPVTAAEVAASPVVADPMRLLDVCATSDGGAVVVLSSPGAPRRRTRCGSARSPPSPRSTRARCPTSRTSPPTPPSPPRPLSPPPNSGRPSFAPRTRRPASVPRAWTWRRCTTCRRRWSWTGTRTWACARRAGRKLLRDGATALGGRIPVAPSGGLSSFGEAVPAQALAQVCEPTWQVARPVGAPAGRGARVGVTANQGLFGHGSSVVVIR